MCNRVALVTVLSSCVHSLRANKCRGSYGGRQGWLADLMILDLRAPAATATAHCTVCACDVSQRRACRDIRLETTDRSAWLGAASSSCALCLGVRIPSGYIRRKLR